MEGSLSECCNESESNAHIKCCINNDVKQLTNTDQSENIYVQTNHNHNHIECIQLDDSEDESHATPRKRLKLTHSPPLPSLPSIPSLPSLTPLPSPLPSQPSLPSPQPSNTLVANLEQLCNSKCETLDEQMSETNNSNSVSISDSINSNNGSEHNDEHNGECKQCKHCKHTDTNTEINKLNNDESKPQLNDKTSKSEQLIKKLISICVEKRFVAQIQRLNTEQNGIKRVKILKNECADRNIALKLIKRANKMKTPTVFTDIGIQINFNENKITDNEANGSESCEEFLKIKQTVQNNVPFVNECNDQKSCPILEKQLVNKEVNACEVLKQNGLIKTIKNESNENNDVNNEAKVSKVENNKNLEDVDEKDIITIDSEDDESDVHQKVVNDEHLKADFSLKVSKHNKSLPVPKLSVSYSKQNNNKYNGKEQLKSVTLKWTISQIDIKNNKSIIEKYLIYMYKDPKTDPKTVNSHPIGCVDALDPPMACTLSNLSKGKYNFYVRAFDCDRQMGPSSNVEQIEIF